MENNAPKSAATVQRALDAKGIKATVRVLSESTRSAQDAAAAIGCDVRQIVKSLIFKTVDTQHPVLILASGPNRVNEKKIEEALGKNIEKADADYVRQVTGFAIGGIPPIGHHQPIPHIFIDEDLMVLEDVWAAAGTPHAVFQIKGQHLLEMIDGHILKIV